MNQNLINSTCILYGRSHCVWVWTGSGWGANFKRLTLLLPPYRNNTAEAGFIQAWNSSTFPVNGNKSGLRQFRFVAYICGKHTTHKRWKDWNRYAQNQATSTRWVVVVGDSSVHLQLSRLSGCHHVLVSIAPLPGKPGGAKRWICTRCYILTRLNTAALEILS